MPENVEFVEVRPRVARNPGFAANVMVAVEQQLLREQWPGDREVIVQINIKILEIVMSESTARRLLAGVRPAMH